MNKKMNNKGFSLVELIVVIAIMAILAVTLAPKLTQYIEKSRKVSDREVVNTIFTAARLANAEYPLPNSSITLNGTVFTVTAVASAKRTDWALTPYTYASNQDFMDTFEETLKSFKLKSNDVSDTTTITLTVNNGYITVGLDYTPTADDTDTTDIDESDPDIVATEE